MLKYGGRQLTVYGGRRLTVGQNQTTKFFFKFGGILRLIPLEVAFIPPYIIRV